MSSNSNQLISVIIPVYNNEESIVDCVNSVLEQTYRPIEIILVNDGSLDNTAEISDCVSSKYPEVKVIHQSNGGPNNARNNGIRNAKGNFLIFLDADDELYSKNTIELNLEFLLKDDELDIVSFPQYRENSEVTDKTEYITKPEQFKTARLTDKRTMFLNWYNGKIIDGAFWGKIYRKSVFDNLELFEGIRFTEDNYTIPDLVERCRAIQISPYGGYIYKYNINSIIHTQFDVFKLYSQFCTEIKLCNYISKFYDVDIPRAELYFSTLEKIYYMINTPYFENSILKISHLKRSKLTNATSNFQKLLCIFTIFFGYKAGITALSVIMKRVLSVKPI